VIELQEIIFKLGPGFHDVSFNFRMERSFSRFQSRSTNGDEEEAGFRNSWFEEGLVVN